MRLIACFLAAALVSAPAAAEDLSKASHGLYVASDCDEDMCRSYAIEVAKKFVRLPVREQLARARRTCAALDRAAEEYEDSDGRPWKIQACLFQYSGEDIIYRDNTDGRMYLESWYVAGLAALRD